MKRMIMKTVTVTIGKTLKSTKSALMSIEYRKNNELNKKTSECNFFRFAFAYR